MFLTWSSTLSKANKFAWCYRRSLDGSNGNIGVNSTVNAIFVRKHVP